jgi:hypothetical protein
VQLRIGVDGKDTDNARDNATDNARDKGAYWMPLLPLIDFMLFSGWTALLIGFVLKVISLMTNDHPTVVGLSAIDFLMIAVAAMLFAIALAARTWVKIQEPTAVAIRRRDETLEAWNALKSGGDDSETESESE